MRIVLLKIDLHRAGKLFPADPDMDGKQACPCRRNRACITKIQGNVMLRGDQKLTQGERTGIISQNHPLPMIIPEKDKPEPLPVTSGSMDTFRLSGRDFIDKQGINKRQGNRGRNILLYEVIADRPGIGMLPLRIDQGKSICLCHKQNQRPAKGIRHGEPERAAPDCLYFSRYLFCLAVSLPGQGKISIKGLGQPVLPQPLKKL